MQRAERQDCIEVCDEYGRCFDLATQERDPLVSMLFETIMNSGDGCQLAGRGGENCTVVRAAQAVLEICRDIGISPDSSALRHYVEQFEEGQASEQG